MAILNTVNLRKTFGTDTVLDNINLEIQKGEHCGLIGTNGSGKTTLFKVLCGIYDSDDGEYYVAKETSIGYMEQHVVRDDNHTAYKEVLSVFAHLEELENEIETINAELLVTQANSDKLIEKQIFLNEKFADLGGLTYKNRVKSTLKGLGFSEEHIYNPVSFLSGGQKAKLQLAKMLLSGANLLLLDEPTNHLDIEATQWLEDFLKNFSGAFIVISHDRYFLDKVTTKTFEISNKRLYTYKGNYSAYLTQRDERRLTMQREYDKAQTEIKRIEGIIEQQKRFNQAANYITIAHKQKSIDRLEATLEKPEDEPDTINFEFKASKRGGNDVLMSEDLGLSFGENHLFSGVNMHIKRLDKVFLLGPNGCGKTSLLKTLLDVYDESAGSHKFGVGIDVGYYDQAQDNLNESKTVIDEIWDLHPNMVQTEVRNALAVFLFRGDDVFKPVKGLSGGERARLLLLKLMLQTTNFLILDEPTNHLDISAREALEEALLSYDGTLLVVSHDRYLINKLADRIMYLDKTGITEYIGNYDNYLEAITKKEEELAVKEEPKVNTYQLNKDKKAKLRKIKNALNRCEVSIEENELLVEETENMLNDPEIGADFSKLNELSKNLEIYKEKLDELMITWEELHLELLENEDDT